MTMEWDPSEIASNVYEIAVLGRRIAGLASREISTRSRPDPESPAVQVTVTIGVFWSELAGGDSAVVVGAIVSIVTRAEAVREWPARSNAVTAIVWAPSAMPVYVNVDAVAGRVTVKVPSRVTSK